MFHKNVVMACLAVTFSITGSNLFASPDLQASWIGLRHKVTFSGDMRFAGRVVATNTGETASTPTIVCYFLSDDTVFGTNDQLLATVRLRALRPGQRTVRYMRVRNVFEASGKYILAVVDPEDVIEESNETNNSTPFQVTQ